jgi:hypothetical protein
LPLLNAAGAVQTQMSAESPLCPFFAGPFGPIEFAGGSALFKVRSVRGA